MKKRHNVYISDRANEIIDQYCPEKYANKSVFIDLCIRKYYEQECEITYYKNYKFLLEMECEQLEGKLAELKKRQAKTVIL